MTVDTSVIGQANRCVARRARPGRARELRGRGGATASTSARPRRAARRVPAPPTFTFAAPYWWRVPTDDQPRRPDRRAAEPDAHDHGRAVRARARSCCTASRSSSTTARRSRGDVLDGVQTITDIYEKETDTANMTFVVMETQWTRRRATARRS